MTSPYKEGSEPTIEVDNLIATEIIQLSEEADAALFEARKFMNFLYSFAALAISAAFTTGVLMALGYWLIGCLCIVGVVGAMSVAHICRYKRDLNVGKAWMKTGEMSRVCETIIKSAEREYRQRYS